jgi:GH24 family phage-related lysozyme (muramidase)
MGIFTDFATSSGGALLQGVLDEADNIARQDAQTNAVVAQNALDKENEAFKKTELAFKHKDELIKTIIANAEEFGIVPGELTVDQIADRLVSKVFNNQRSIFELPNFASVSTAFARNLAKLPGEEIILDNPYTASENLFNQEAEKHSARISAITKMPKADKLLHNIKKAEEKVESPEVIFNKAMTIAPLSAKAYGILGFYPDSKEGRDALGFMKSSLIVANARFYHPDDPNARAQFVERKLFENQIDPFAALQFTSPMNFRQITNVLDQMSSNVSNQMLMLTNKMNNPELTEEGRLEIKGQIDNLLLEQMKQVNNASKVATMQIAGRNVNVSTQAPIVEDKKIIPKKEEKKKGVLEKIGDIIPSGDFDKKFAIQESEKAKAKQEKNKNKPTVQEEQEDMLPDDGTIRSDSISALQAGLAGNDKFIKRIMQDEGEPFLEATKVFDDEKNFTIGYGRNNASIKKGDKITVEQAQKNLAEDVKIRLEEIQDLIPNFSNLSDQLQLALFSEYYRGSVRQSPKTVKLINEGKFSEAAAEFLDNDEYRNAVGRNRRGIRKRMKKVFNLLRREGTEDSPAV